jgi:hypothetical protein
MVDIDNIRVQRSEEAINSIIADDEEALIRTSDRRDNAPVDEGALEVSARHHGPCFAILE